MSRYSDKHRAAPCQAECDAPGTTVVMYRGRLSWVCDRHANECPDCLETHEETR